MFGLPEAWVWDFWLADDGEKYHLFFLYASRALHEPNARHLRAAIGHAVSDDLSAWTRVTDALVHGDDKDFDSAATWTGSVVRHPDGTWFLFYTGAQDTADGNIQRIGFATSPDLLQWTKNPANPVVTADTRWYEVLADGQWRDEAFRDPWVLPDPDGNGWHMLITARANSGPADQRGVVGHAWSPDLREWEVRPPLSEPGQGFGQLEVNQIEDVDGHLLLLFSCLAGDLDASRRNGPPTGVWCAKAASPLGPFDLAGAQVVTDSTLYSGRLIRRRDSGGWVMLAFQHDDPLSGEFVGEIIDPVPVRWQDGRLVLDDPGTVTTTSADVHRAVAG